MSLANEQSEVRVSVLVDSSSLASLGEILLGDADAPEAAIDCTSIARCTLSPPDSAEHALVLRIDGSQGVGGPTAGS
jgi:hypothetical protein